MPFGSGWIPVGTAPAAASKRWKTCADDFPACPKNNSKKFFVSGGKTGII
jgi:hypothetical protein